MVEWEWYHISDKEIAHLYNSIPHCIAAVIKADGWYTEYNVSATILEVEYM